MTLYCRSFFLWIFYFLFYKTYSQQPTTTLLFPVVVCWSGRCDGADGAKVHFLQHLLGLSINLDAFIARLELRDFWDKVVTTFTLVFLELDGNATHRAQLVERKERVSPMENVSTKRTRSNKAGLHVSCEEV